MSIVWYFVALVVLIALSAFFSASEMSYSSANRLRLENAAEDGSRRARAAVGILDHYDRALSAILIGNNLVNIASSSLGSVIVILLAGEQWTWVSTVVLTLLVIIFGETMPKIVAKQNANGIALRNAYVIRALSVVLYPVIWLVVGLVHLITRPLRGDTGDGDPEEAASQELQSIIETAEDEDVLDEDRSELLRSALDFSDISASEAMTARVDMVAIDIDDDWDEILRVIDESTYSRLPVYSDSVDNIIGFLYLNRFFKAMMDGRPDDLRAQLIPPCFVYKTTRLPDVLAKLRREQKHLAVVTDEYGGTLGVITMEDVLEELVGDIWDENRRGRSARSLRGSDGGYELDGDMTISDFLELLGWNEDALDDADSATVGGWTLERFGTFPKPGDSFRYENLTVTVLAMDGRRVERVLVQPDPASEDKDE
ncbi:MAG: hemolysin family protein [Oscillospiraceae bacterium]